MLICRNKWSKACTHASVHSAYICTPFTNTPVDTPFYNDGRHPFTIYTTYRDGGESEGCRLVLARRPTFYTTLLAPPPLPSPQLFMEISRHAVLLLAVFNNKKVNEICGWSRKGREEVRGGRRGERERVLPHSNESLLAASCNLGAPKWWWREGSERQPIDRIA